MRKKEWSLENITVDGEDDSDLMLSASNALQSRGEVSVANGKSP